MQLPDGRPRKLVPDGQDNDLRNLSFLFVRPDLFNTAVVPSLYGKRMKFIVSRQ